MKYMFKYEHCLSSVAIGDYCGSSFEGRNGFVYPEELNDISLINNSQNRFTDDTVCTFAITSALLNKEHDWANQLKTYCRFYNVGYAPLFHKWINGEIESYNSWGNGAAMRCSPIGFYAKSITELEELVKSSCECTHNTQEAILGATILCHAIWLAKQGESKETIMKMFYNRMPDWKDIHIETFMNDILEIKGEEVNFKWYLKCDNIVGMIMKAFEVSENFEHALYMAISLGYDTDTAGAIMGPLAYAYYKEIPQKYLDITNKLFDPNMKSIEKIFCNTINE